VSDFPAAVPAVLIAALTVINAWRRDRALGIIGAMTGTALACAAVLMAYQYACFGSPFHLAYSSEEGYIGMQQGIFGVNVPRLIRLGGFFSVPIAACCRSRRRSRCRRLDSRS